VRLPLLIRVPGYDAGSYSGTSSAVDMMPTVLDLFGQPPPGWVEGLSLLPAMRDRSTSGRDFVVSTIPFANPGSFVRSVDNISRPLATGLATTVTSGDWSFLFSGDPGRSELYDLSSDPGQQRNLIGDRPEVARELHRTLVGFMRDTGLPEHLLNPQLELKL
jgi:arylsulfatase A-like enzyme